MLDLPWYAFIPIGVLSVMFSLISAGYIYGVVQAYRDGTSDSIETHE